MAVNGKYFERFKNEHERSVKKINLSKSYTSDEKRKQKRTKRNEKGKEHLPHSNDFQI